MLVEATAAFHRVHWWQCWALFVVVFIVMNGVVFMTTETHRANSLATHHERERHFIDRRSVSKVLLANADLRLGGWRTPRSEAFGGTLSPLASFQRLLSHILDLHEDGLAPLSVAVVTDPRAFAADCIQANSERETCVDEALVYHAALNKIYSAPIHPRIPVLIAPEDSPRGKVLKSRHRISCWSPSAVQEPVDLLEVTAAAGSHCLLVLDAMDIHEYPSYSAEVLEWFLGHLLSGAGENGGRAEVLAVRHPYFMTSIDGRWGDFLDVLDHSELERIETAAWPFLVEHEMAVEAEDIFFVYMMYAEDNLQKWRASIEAMMLSIEQNGGALRRASGALLVYTPHGEERPSLDDLVPLMEAANVNVVFRPTPWESDVTDAWTLHFLKTDVSSFDEAWQHAVVIFLDLDMLILDDIVPFISPRHLRMTPATFIVAMTTEEWERHGFDGEGRREMHHFGEMEAAYYNSGVMMAPSAVFAAFLQQTEVEAEIELRSGQQSLLTRDQLMFEFAHYRLEPPFLELPHDLNLDSNLRVDLGCEVLRDPLVYHYHKQPLVDGVPEVPPPGLCIPYNNLRSKLLSFSEYYARESVLVHTDQEQNDVKMYDM